MSDAARLTPIQPMDDSDIDDPDTGLIIELRDSERPERILRAQEMARTKLGALAERRRRRALKRRSDPPSR